jgi:hypothetical protein
MFEPWLARANMDAAGHQILTAETLPALHTAVTGSHLVCSHRRP